MERIEKKYWLLPFALLYGIGVRFRNQLFDWGILRTEQYDVPVISVGNITVGGTGKTPHIEFLIRLFVEKKYRVAVLSRGYKRKTKGFLLAGSDSSSADIGDEPYQLKQKFPEVTVAVDADRRNGISQLLALEEKLRPNVILLDDAFQHRYVIPSLSILLTDIHYPYYEDALLPVGRLREPASGVRRADIVIITKCSGEMQPIDYRIVMGNVKLCPYQRLFFSNIGYGELYPLFPEVAEARSLSELKSDEDVLLMAGIASPELFVEKIKSHSSKVFPALFADHYNYRPADINRLDSILKKMESPSKLIITTEKDAARLKNATFLPDAWKKLLYALPITVNFQLNKEDDFKEMLIKHVVTVLNNKI